MNRGDFPYSFHAQILYEIHWFVYFKFYYNNRENWLQQRNNYLDEAVTFHHFLLHF